MTQTAFQPSGHRSRCSKLVTNASNSSQFEYNSIQLNSPQLTPTVFQSPDRHSQCFKVVANLSCISWIRRNSNTTRLNSIQALFNSSLLIVIQLNVPQLISRCQCMSLNCHNLPKMRRTLSRSAHLPRLPPSSNSTQIVFKCYNCLSIIPYLSHM